MVDVVMQKKNQSLKKSVQPPTQKSLVDIPELTEDFVHREDNFFVKKAS